MDRERGNGSPQRLRNITARGMALLERVLRNTELSLEEAHKAKPADGLLPVHPEYPRKHKRHVQQAVQAARQQCGLPHRQPQVNNRGEKIIDHAHDGSHHSQPPNDQAIRRRQARPACPPHT